MVVPKLGKVKNKVSLTKEAKRRLQWIDYYQTHGNNARLTCRHFGIVHHTFYRYYERFKSQEFSGLEAKSHRPSHVRQPPTPRLVIDRNRILRKTNPELSKYKLRVILTCDYGYSLSPSSISRTISSHQAIIDVWLRKYHSYRPRQALNYLTPDEYAAKLKSNEVALIL